MAEASVDLTMELEKEDQYKALLTNSFPKLCPRMIEKMVHSGKMDLVQMVTHLSGLDVKAQHQAIAEEARAFMSQSIIAEDDKESKKKRKSSQVKKYTSDFNVAEFVALFPNPEETFHNPERESKVEDYTTMFYVERYFMNRYPSIYKTYISSLLYKTPEHDEYHRLLEIDEKLAWSLESGKNVMKCRRKLTSMKITPGDDILLLQELAYLEHREDIQNYIQEQKRQEAEKRQYAIDNGLTKTCQCCFTENLLPDETYTCNNDCFFCAECIQKSCELKLGEDNIQFPCLTDCGSQLAWTTLQAALPPTLFSKLSQRCTESEIRAAGIKFDSCPFCNFTNIIDDERYTLFQCLNPDCMKETCILCKELNHLPLRCEEVEKDEDVKARLHVENKMTDALLRICSKCNRKFIKDEDGCNKITCVCGAMSCYICSKPVDGYSHFNGLGGDKHQLCPLYSDMHEMHKKEVAKAAEEAKKEVGHEKLKVDPSADINKYYEYKKKNTRPPRWMEAYQDVIRAREALEDQRNNLQRAQIPAQQPAPIQRQIPIEFPRPVQGNPEMPGPIQEPMELPRAFQVNWQLLRPIQQPMELPRPVQRNPRTPRPVRLPIPVPGRLQAPRFIQEAMELPRPVQGNPQRPRRIQEPVGLPRPVQVNRQQIQIPEHIPAVVRDAIKNAKPRKSTGIGQPTGLRNTIWPGTVTRDRSAGPAPKPRPPGGLRAVPAGRTK